MFRHLVPLGLLLAALGCGEAGHEESGSTGADREPESFGRFEGDVVGVWSPNGRDMTLREDFAYLDPRGTRWEAPTGSVVNGASIPRVFWSAIGGPFEGRYRNASVIHDVACVEMTQPWEDVHKMFYEACRCGGVGESKAKLIYWAVRSFGPRWRIERILSSDGSTTVQVSEPMTPPPPPADIAVIAAEFFENNSPTLEQIETLTVAEIEEAVQQVEEPHQPPPDGMETEQPEPPEPEQPQAAETQDQPATEAEAAPAEAEAAPAEAEAPATEAEAPATVPPQEPGPAMGQSEEPATAGPPDPEP